METVGDTRGGREESIQMAGKERQNKQGGREGRKEDGSRREKRGRRRQKVLTKGRE